jgi:hypothetical protein
MKLATEVNTMLPRDVAKAICIMCCAETPWVVKTNIRMGTTTTPPPIPSNPAMIPTTAPNGG